MDDPFPALDRLADAFDGAGRLDVDAWLDRFETAPADERKAAVQAVRSVVEADPSRVASPAFEPVPAALPAALDDDERAVRLATAKLFVTVADADPDAATPAVPALAEALADDDEFYFVRARAAEALGYVAAARPDVVVTPAFLADLRVGLEFDEPEVRGKLAKALAGVAFGDPARLRGQVSTLATHLDDGTDLVRYHLTTALVAVACECPTALEAGTDALVARLDDGNAYVRGRAAEALGLYARAADDQPLSATAVGAAEDPFADDRCRFAATVCAGDDPDPAAGIGDIEAIRDATDEIAAEIASVDAGECPHCGFDLPGGEPPLCPRCGAPR